MADYGQPDSFYVDWIVPTEYPAAPGGLTASPANILQVGDNLKLRTYFVWWGTNVFERNAVKAAVTGAAASVAYYFDDLEAGGTPIKVAGGSLTQLTSLDALANSDGYTSWDFATTDLYRSEDTVDITTGVNGSGKTLVLPTAAATQGTWQVTVVLNGGVGSNVSAFSTDMFIQIIK